MTKQNISDFVKNWLSDRKLDVYDFQVKILVDELTDAFVNNDKVVLASCVGSGKTMMSILYMDLYLIQNTSHRILVLAHGTTVLRTQFYDAIAEYQPNFSHCLIDSSSQLKDCKAQVVVTIPQTITRLRTLPHFDMVVVDEAHEYYSKKNKKSDD